MSELADRMVKSLNQMLELDSTSILLLHRLRVTCNQELTQHATLPFFEWAGEKVQMVSLIGILNSCLDSSKERVVLDATQPDGPFHFVVLTPESHPDDFDGSLKVSEDRFDDLCKLFKGCIPLHGQYCVVREYAKGEDGRYAAKKVLKLIDEDDPIMLAAHQAAEEADAGPGLAVGFMYRDKDGNEQVQGSFHPLSETPSPAPENPAESLSETTTPGE